MKAQKAMVLIITLVLLLVMTLLVSAMLLVSQLSHKSAHAGQQQLLVSQLALQQHLGQVNQLQGGQLDSEPLSECPPQYAAWSGGAVQCEMLQLSTETYSDSRLFYAAYTSLVLRQDVPQEPE